MKKLFLILVIATTIGTVGCTYNKEEELYRTPPPTCNTANVTFSTTIAGIFTTYACNSCHSGPSPSGNVSLASYNSVKTLVNNGRLYGAINHAAGFSPMPQGGGKMPACDIAKVKAWIDAGAPNN
ncbi:MAG TPA: hypothetical protein VEY06_12875 [Flavisolibacter sp.]|jgi:hypothetical protein|nr:hypothetical protein [Flavisolibacter sp.]